MKARMMLTCLCDAFYGEAGIAAVKALRHAGCDVEFPENQTCCGQPPYNAGDWAAARPIVEHVLKVFPDDGVPIVVPSGSCTAMVREGYPLLFPGRKFPPTFELAEFLVEELKVERWPVKGVSALKPRRVAFHRSCHTRGIHLGATVEKLLSTIPGLELVPFGQAEQCCGFGGAFSATHSKVSSAIGEEKLHHVLATGATELVSGDMGCLMHLDGLIRRQGLNLKIRHYAELLAEAIPSEERVEAAAR